MLIGFHRGVSQHDQVTMSVASFSDGSGGKI